MLSVLTENISRYTQSLLQNMHKLFLGTIVWAPILFKRYENTPWGDNVNCSVE